MSIKERSDQPISVLQQNGSLDVPCIEGCAGEVGAADQTANAAKVLSGEETYFKVSRECKVGTCVHCTASCTDFKTYDFVYSMGNVLWASGVWVQGRSYQSPTSKTNKHGDNSFSVQFSVDGETWTAEEVIPNCEDLGEDTCKLTRSAVRMRYVRLLVKSGGDNQENDDYMSALRVQDTGVAYEVVDAPMGKGLKFDGVDQYAYFGEPSAASDELFSLTDVTISAFIKLDAPTSDMIIVEIGEKFSREHLVSVAVKANGHLYVAVDDGATGDAGSQDKIDTLGPDLRDGVWHHVVVVRDPEELPSRSETGPGIK